jgi:dTDP-4-dehydrorhamnose reductase
MKVLVLGASGMLGATVLRYFDQRGEHRLRGVVRSADSFALFDAWTRSLLAAHGDLTRPGAIDALLEAETPHVLINCVGVVKQLAAAEDPLVVLPVNSLLPHQLALACHVHGTRLIHVSTDCVFSGAKGCYTEDDESDARDLYGRSKLLGELTGGNAITLRTSIIGPELERHTGLLDWFLAQKESVRGYRQAIFSGLTTFELAKVMHDQVLPNPALHGLYHVASQAIDKCDLLQRLARAYKKQILVVPDDAVKIDRSLNAARFEAATGYRCPDWDTLILEMERFG